MALNEDVFYILAYSRVIEDQADTKTYPEGRKGHLATRNLLHFNCTVNTGDKRDLKNILVNQPFLGGALWWTSCQSSICPIPSGALWRVFHYKVFPFVVVVKDKICNL